MKAAVVSNGFLCFTQLLLHSLCCILHAGSLFGTFEQIHIHFAKAVSKVDSYQLWVIQAVVVLYKILAVRILVLLACSEDVVHANTYCSCIVLQEAFSYSYISTPVCADITLGRRLCLHHRRTRLTGTVANRQIGFALIIGRQLDSKVTR